MKKESFDNATLFQGDCLRLLDQISEPIHSVITDPPYSSGGQFRGDRTVRTSVKYQSAEHRGLYSEFSGDNRDQRSYYLWSVEWMSMVRDLMAETGFLVVFSDWRQLPTTTDAIQVAGFVWRGIGVWDKTEASRPQKGRFRNQCEFFAWATKGACRTDGPCLPGVFRYSVFSETKQHITGKPIALFSDILQLAGETVLDPFMGSGTTGVACAKKGKRFIGMEISENYFDIATKRIRDAYSQGRLF